MKTIPELQTEAFQTNRDHGFEGNPVPTAIALMHSELSEALESFRQNEPVLWVSDKGKPEGLLAEYADVVIRILSDCGERGYDLYDAIEKKRTTSPVRLSTAGKSVNSEDEPCQENNGSRNAILYVFLRFRQHSAHAHIER